MYEVNPSLRFALRRLARVEETTDPHIESEAWSEAKVTIGQLAHDIERGNL